MNTCVCEVCAHVCARMEARRPHRGPCLALSTLRFETGALTEAGAHHFRWIFWPVVPLCLPLLCWNRRRVLPHPIFACLLGIIVRHCFHWAVFRTLCFLILHGQGCPCTNPQASIPLATTNRKCSWCFRLPRTPTPEPQQERLWERMGPALLLLPWHQPTPPEFVCLFQDMLSRCRPGSSWTVSLVLRVLKLTRKCFVSKNHLLLGSNQISNKASFARL